MTHGTTRHGYTEYVVLQRMIAVYSHTLCADAAMHRALAYWVSVSAYIVMRTIPVNDKVTQQNRPFSHSSTMQGLQTCVMHCQSKST